MGFFIVISFMFPVGNTVRYITSEKENQLKEAMIIMGVPCWLHWIGWFIRTMIFMIIAISICVAVIKVHLDVSWTLLWIFLFVYSISMTTYCFLLSSLFSKASMASIGAMAAWFALLVPYAFLIDSSESEKFVACISSNIALVKGMELVYVFERKNGLQWSNVWETLPETGNFSLGIVACFLLGSSLLYLLLALYIEKVLPDKYGVPAKWYFPFTKEFWCGVHSNIESEDGLVSSNPNFESNPQHFSVGIKIKNLRKIYANKNVAVNGLTLNVFDDQITILLGANGAGKTTVMSMLTGWLAPTSGSALLNGYDIRTNLQKARSSIGYCPQHNILFDELTVREHIEFFGRLKGLRKTDINHEVNKYIQQLEMYKFIDKTSQSLSGGMKRKLSVVIALCGGSNVVFLDEPSSGLDPTARHGLWNLLQAEKKGRTILLTTHFMDEADALGDRIAIMAKGELKCHGTPFFLKARFGSGYRLICAKNDECNVNAVTDTLREFIPDIHVHEDIGSEFTYVLPAEHVDKFQHIFELLERNQHDLGISSFGVSMTPLEEIFLKVSSDGRLSDKAQPQQNGFDTTDFEEPSSTPLLIGLSFHLNQWHAMFKKRFICCKRRWIMLVFQNLIPPFTVLLMVFALEDLGYFENVEVVILYSLAFVATSKFYIMFHIRERATKSKLLQFVCGVNVYTYWMSSFLFDYILYLLMAVISIVPFLVYEMQNWIDITGVIVAVAAFGFSILPIIYVASFLFTSPSAGLNAMAIIPIMLNFILRVIPTQMPETEDEKKLQWYFLIFPSYSFVDSCIKCVRHEENAKSNAFSWDYDKNGILRNLTYLVIVGVVSFGILAAIELSKSFEILKNKTQSLNINDIDDDVLKEKQNVDAMTKAELRVTNLVLRKLTKNYSGFVAVNKMSIAVKRAECFGLLGVNGAGKTSTFKMLTGDIAISSGEAYVQGICLKCNMLKVNKIIGYCPQFDALLNDLTGMETMEIFALLRGVRRNDIPSVIERLANELDFKAHLNKKISEYSGGNKRKVSTAIALIGDPVVIYLDEPSSAMDAGAKRLLWQCLSKVRSSGKSIILTSHSMEECEALCTRLAIMVNGELKCLGSTQHLKNKFSKGFWLTIKMMNTDDVHSESTTEGHASQIKDFVIQNVTEAELREEYNGFLKYYIPPSDLKWSSMFGIMEIAKQTLPIEDYS
ncbi:ATP-binding cassette sub-family A member 3-like, partial [Contarinia nasturtii]|uniref:ATP-binding cassette sub-family A member 3-like n=1 Tax=Contarinia nasturtii TaxID=265458 RepID=UPI0012D486C3